MEAHFPPELEQLIEEWIASGRFSSRGHFIEAATGRLLDGETLREIKLARLKAEVQKGLDDLDAGRSQILDRALLERIKGRQDARAAQMRAAIQEGEESANQGGWLEASEVFDWVKAEGRRRLSEGEPD